MRHGLLLIIVVGTFASPIAAASRPNIVFLFSDDQTAGAVGCYGNPEIQTPHLDRLASDGVRFVNHYDTTSICMASRCSVMTGRYEYRHGCNFGLGDLPRARVEQSYPVLLRKAGYFTGFAGKIGFVIDGEPFDALAPLFDCWAGGPGQTFYETDRNRAIASYAAEFPHCSRAYGAWARDFLKDAKQSGKPFCLSVSFKAPHLPFTPDPLDMPRYAGRSFTKPSNFGKAHGTHLARQTLESRAARVAGEWLDDFDETTAAYYALISGVDAAVGMIREALDREDLADDTVIIFTSDNGYSRGAHGFGDKVLPYEEASKAPLIIYDPRLPAERRGRVCEAVTGNVDMAATIFALAGVDAPQIDGLSLLPLLENPTGSVREYLPLFNFWGIHAAQSMAVVSRDWKYVYWYYGEGMEPTEELFHLATNRTEMHNLAGDPSHAADLDAPRRAYDVELARLARNVVKGRAYENFAVLFDRKIAWDRKAPLLAKLPEPTAAGEGKGALQTTKPDAEAGTKPKQRKKKSAAAP